MGGHRKPALDPHRAFILKRLSQTHSKKTLFALEQDRSDIARRRRRWRSWQA
jgi:hypothetical protein